MLPDLISAHRALDKVSMIVCGLSFVVEIVSGVLCVKVKKFVVSDAQRIILHLL